VNPTVYSRMRIKNPSAFITRVLAQPKIWLIGDNHVISA
jgi:hypothetical protein